MQLRSFQFERFQKKTIFWIEGNKTKSTLTIFILLLKACETGYLKNFSLFFYFSAIFWDPLMNICQTKSRHTMNFVQKNDIFLIYRRILSISLIVTLFSQREKEREREKERTLSIPPYLSNFRKILVSIYFFFLCIY